VVSGRFPVIRAASGTAEERPMPEFDDNAAGRRPGARNRCEDF
jgi:hypothetical protein